MPASQAPSTAPSTRRLIGFVVTEGPEVRVASVTFVGNVALTAEQLRAVIATRPAGVLEKGLFRQDILDRDVAALQAFARTQGFADATVGPAGVRFEDDRTRAYIVIPVVEGSRVRVGRVDAEGQTLFATDGAPRRDSDRARGSMESRPDRGGAARDRAALRPPGLSRREG